MAISLDESSVEPGAPPASSGEHAAISTGESAGSEERVRERFWNLPNSITLLRAAVVPVLLFFPLFHGGPDGGPGEYVSTVFAWFFIVAALSDLLDGWLARRGQMVTQLGKLLDPLADKLLVSTALIVLLAIGRIEVEATWMVVVIIGRELAVTGLRGLASAGGQVMAASRLGKAKALAQNIAIGALLFHFETIGADAHRVGIFFLVLATGLTLVSGYRYFAEYFRGLDQAAFAPEKDSRP